jgi:WD40 repeat protein
MAYIGREKDKKVFTGHFDDILSMTISGDGKFLATGGSDKRICIWQTSTMAHLKTFTQHRGPVMVATPFRFPKLTGVGLGMSFLNKPIILL